VRARRAIAYALQVVLLAAVYAASGRFGLALEPVGGVATLFWPPTAIALVGLLKGGLRLWPAVVLGVVLLAPNPRLNVLGGAGIAAGNTLEAVLGAWALGRFVGLRGAPTRLSQVPGFVAVAALGSTLVSATLGTASLLQVGQLPAAAARQVWWSWWLGDATSTVVLAPALLVWAADPRSAWQALREPRRMVEAVCLGTGLLVFLLFAFESASAARSALAQPAVILAFLLWAALRFGLHGATASTLLTSMVAVWSTARGHGPFTGPDLTTSLRFLQVFMSTASIVALCLALALEERDRTARQARSSEAFFRALQQESPDGAAVIGAEGGLQFVSAAFQTILGVSPQDLMQSPPFSWVHIDDRPRLRAAVARLLKGEAQIERHRFRARHRDGSWRYLESVARNRLADPDVAGVLVNTRDVTEQVRLAARVNQVREEEKTRVARDLHDQLGQLLTSLKLDLVWLEERLEFMPATPETVGLVERVVAASELSEQTVAEVQRIATDLRPAALDRIGLGAALLQEGRRFEARTGLTCRVEVEAGLPALPPSTATALYRIAQEALTNVARHARAQVATVRLTAVPGVLELLVVDDGRGFDPALARMGSALGLAGMRERAELEGGELLVDADAGGTRVMARVPIPVQQEQA